jgi:hypothetical protein
VTLRTLFFAILPLTIVSCNKAVISSGNSGSSGSTGSKTDTTTSTTPPAPKKWVVSTLAGSGSAGFADGDSNLAQFSNPECIAVDQNGILYVGDIANASIRKISPSGEVTTYAGRNVGNPNPLFGNIFGVVVDKQENVYDIEANFMRKISPVDSSSIQFAGNFMVAYVDGQGTAASFDYASNMAIDSLGNIFFPDYDASGVFHMREVTPSGMVSTLTLQDNYASYSNGLPNYHYLYAVAVNPLGGLYVTANGNSLIKKIDASGNVTIFAGGSLGFTDGQGTAALFNTILGLACDTSGNLYVSDGGNNAIRKITPTGMVSTIAGGGGSGFQDGDSTKAKFNDPYGITVDKNGVVYVVDNQNNSIRKLVYQ